MSPPNGLATSSTSTSESAKSWFNISPSNTSFSLGQSAAVVQVMTSWPTEYATNNAQQVHILLLIKPVSHVVMVISGMAATVSRSAQPVKFLTLLATNVCAQSAPTGLEMSALTAPWEEYSTPLTKCVSAPKTPTGMATPASLANAMEANHGMCILSLASAHLELLGMALTVSQLRSVQAELF